MRYQPSNSPFSSRPLTFSRSLPLNAMPGMQALSRNDFKGKKIQVEDDIPKVVPPVVLNEGARNCSKTMLAYIFGEKIEAFLSTLPADANTMHLVDGIEECEPTTKVFPDITLSFAFHQIMEGEFIAKTYSHVSQGFNRFLLAMGNRLPFFVYAYKDGNGEGWRATLISHNAKVMEDKLGNQLLRALLMKPLSDMSHMKCNVIGWKA